MQLGPSGFEVPPKASRLRVGAKNSEGPNHETFAQIQNNPYFHFFLHLCHQVALKQVDFRCLLFSQFRFVPLSLVVLKLVDWMRLELVRFFVFLLKLVCANVISVTVTFNDVAADGFSV